MTRLSVQPLGQSKHHWSSTPNVHRSVRMDGQWCGWEVQWGWQTKTNWTKCANSTYR